MAKKYKHVAVIGRIPEDDEDTCLFYSDITEAGADRAFKRDIYEIDGRKPKDVLKGYSVTHFVTRMLSSETPFNIV